MALFLGRLKLALKNGYTYQYAEWVEVIGHSSLLVHKVHNHLAVHLLNICKNYFTMKKKNNGPAWLIQQLIPFSIKAQQNLCLSMLFQPTSPIV